MTEETRRENLDALIARWEKPMLRLCFAFLCDTALAEDAVQETFFKAWKSMDRFRGEAQEKTWLTRIAINTCKDLMKSAWMRNTDRFTTPDFLPEAVYGLTELHREEVKNARILANPGCYTTCSILTAYPLVKAGVIDPSTLIIDALSGVSGAGRSGKVANLFSEVNESAKAYGVASHRHTPEIEQELSLASGEAFTLTFTPHLVPMNRGILATEYAALTKKADGSLWTEAEIRAIYEEAYGNEAFIRLLPAGVCPDTRAVEGTNLVDINFKLDPRTGRIILMGALDNLMKGAAGQAVQNMNVMFGLPETEGLEFIPVMP